MSLHAEVKIDVIVHATEDVEKIFESFLSNFDLDRKNFEFQNLTGHFDNPITLLSINLKKKNAQVFISMLRETMNKTDFAEIYENIEESLSSSGLKLKISKQKMIEGEIVLENKDAVKINISCPVYVKKDSKKIYQQLLQLAK
jgi:hypothetical protein